MGTGFDDLAEAFQWVMNKGLVEAHNAFFERGIWTNICQPSYGWPAIDPMTWRCSAAKAAAHALPRKLEDAGHALHLRVVKDADGHATMMKMAKPRKPKQSDWLSWGKQHAPCITCRGTGRVASLKKDGTPTKKGVKCETCTGRGVRPLATLPAMPTLWHESRELLDRLFTYCRCDVLAEEAISDRLPDLNPAETNAYLMDQIVNERGFRLDREAISAALELIEEENREYNRELAEITNGAVERASQRARMLAWLEDNNFPLEDTQAATLDAVLDGTDLGDPPPPHVRRALELMRALGRSSTAKYETMNDWICPDDRAHGGLLYHGAATGRWSGAGIQPHNFPRGVVKIGDISRAWKVIKTRDRALIESTDYTFKEKQ